VNTNNEGLSLTTAFQIVLGLAKESAFTKTQVGTSPELNAAMQREHEAIARIEAIAKHLPQAGGFPGLAEQMKPYIERSGDTMEDKPLVTLAADARLENWTMVQVPSGGFILTGKVYDDRKGRFPDGATIYTSKVMELQLDGTWAKTRNTAYRLGKRADANAD
jgi:hypothetical protein